MVVEHHIPCVHDSETIVEDEQSDYRARSNAFMQGILFAGYAEQMLMNSQKLGWYAQYHLNTKLYHG